MMLENNSFDRMLGSLFAETVDGGGIKGSAANHWNDDASANPKPPARHVMAPTTARVIRPDPMHEYPNVQNQLAGPNKGFVTDYAKTYPDTDWMQRQGWAAGSWFMAMTSLLRRICLLVSSR